MAKFCEVCKNSYPDDQDLCPHCGAEQVALFEADVSDSEDFAPGASGSAIPPTEATLHLGRNDPGKETHRPESAPPATDSGEVTDEGYDESATLHLPDVPSDLGDEVFAEREDHDSAIEVGEDAIVMEDHPAPKGSGPRIEPDEGALGIEDSAVTLGEGPSPGFEGDAGSALILGEDSGVGSGVGSDVGSGESGIELVEEQITEESVHLGADAGPDPIAEAVESGIDIVEMGSAREGDETGSDELPGQGDAPSSVQMGTPPATDLASPEEMEEALGDSNRTHLARPRGMKEDPDAPGRNPTQVASPGEMDKALADVTAETILLGQEGRGSGDSAVSLGEEEARDEDAAGINLDRLVEEEIEGTDGGSVAEINIEEELEEEELLSPTPGGRGHAEEDRPAVSPAKGRSRVPALVLGGVLGVVGGAGATVGLLSFLPAEYRGMVGLGDTSQPAPLRPGPTPGPGPGPGAVPPGPQESQAALVEGGKFKDALVRLENIDPNSPEDLALRGQARWRATMQEKATSGQPFQVADPEVQQALGDLQNAAQKGNADALFWLGHLQAATGQLAEARNTYTRGADQFKEQRRFQSALDRLDLLQPMPGGMSHVPQARQALLAWLLIAFQPPPAGPDGQPGPAGVQPIEEAGHDFFSALKQARQGKFSEAIPLLRAARDRHNQRRFRHLGKQQNPFSDPDEEIFLHAAALLEDHWLLQQKVLTGAAGLGLASKTNPTKAVDEMVQAATVGKTSTQTLTTVVEKLGGPKAITSEKDLAGALDQLLAERQILSAFAKQLQDAKVIADPKELPKGIDALLADSRALGTAEAKLKSAKVLADGQQLNAGLDKLLTEQKALAAVAERLKKGAVISDDQGVDQGVATLLEARKALTGSLQGIAEDLKKAGLLDARAGAEKAPAGVQEAIKLAKMNDPAGEVRKQRAEIDRLQDVVMAARKKAEDEVAAAQAALMDRWTPKEMLAAWLPVLEGAPTDAELAGRARRDAERVLADPKASAAEKGRAQVILGLAHRNAGQFAQAKEELEKGAEALAGDTSWQSHAQNALRNVSDPVGAILREADRLVAQGKLSEAEGLLDRGVRGLPADQQLDLRVRRGLLALEKVEADGSAKPDESRVAQIREDAKAAQAAGLAVGHYAEGRLAEQLGNLTDAVRHYEEALKAHPAKDEEGLRYRSALARVLIMRAEGGALPTSRERARGTGHLPVAIPADRRTGASLRVFPWQSRETAALEAVILLTALALPPTGGVDVSEDTRRAQELADEILGGGDKVPFNLRAQALAIKGLHTRAVMTYAEGLRGHLPPTLSNGLVGILQGHPSLQRPAGSESPDPIEADNHYAAGLNRFFAEDFASAEKEMAEAVRLYGRDARYHYFLGLARLQQGKRGAQADFEEGARLEQLGLPPQEVVSRSLERIQGPVRLLLNQVRQR